MAEIFVRNGWKQWIAALFLASFSIFVINPNTAQAERVRYPAQLDGCLLGAVGLQWARPTCSGSVAAYYSINTTDTSASCDADIITANQPVTCTVSGTLLDGNPFSFTATQQMWPWYICSYGALPGSSVNGVDAFNCEYDLDNINSVKNLGNNASCDSVVGNPIHARTGNKSTIEFDYNSQSLTFIRHYNSQQNKLDRHIGIRWRHTYSSKLIFSQNDTLSMAFIERSNGRSLIFTLENDLWNSDEDISDQLLELPSGNWQFITTDDTIEHYDTNGNLIAIIDPDDRTQTLTYDANGRLIVVSDDVGRTLGFTYDSSSRIDTLTDPAGGIYWYSYDTVGNLISVTYPDGKVRTYHYNEPTYTSGANLPNALTGIADENGVRYATYTYDTSGRAIITEHASGADRHQLSYSTDGSNTVVTDPLGSQYTRQFQTILGVAKNIGQSQPAGSGCSAASSATTYDINGNATVVPILMATRPAMLLI